MPRRERGPSGLEAVQPTRHQGPRQAEEAYQLPRPRRPLRPALCLQVQPPRGGKGNIMLKSNFHRSQTANNLTVVARHARRRHQQEDRGRRVGSTPPKRHVRTTRHISLELSFKLGKLRNRRPTLSGVLTTVVPSKSNEVQQESKLAKGVKDAMSMSPFLFGRCPN